MRTYTNSMKFHNKYWNYDTGEKTAVFIYDWTDFGYGGAMVIPINEIVVSLAPLDLRYSTIPGNERFQWLFSHEQTHIVMSDKASGSDLFWRKVFGGKVQRDARYPLTALYTTLTTPRWYTPRWYQEGIAIFMETWLNGGSGRILGNYDEMYFRTLALENERIYSLVGLDTEGTSADFQVGGNSYLYGARFMSYLTANYGVDKFKRWVTRTDSSDMFIQPQFKKVYGISLNKAWKDWIAYERDFQKKNAERLSQYPVTSARLINGRKYGSMSQLLYDGKNGKIYAGVNYPGALAHVVEIDAATGKERNLSPIYTPQLYSAASIAFDPDRMKLYMSTQQNDFQGLSEIDIKTGRAKQLLRYTRVGGLVFNPHNGKLYGVRQNNGYSTLVSFSAPYNSYDLITQLYAMDFGKTVFDLALSHDGTKLIASLSKLDGGEEIICFDLDELEHGLPRYSVIFSQEHTDLNQFSFSADDKSLYGTSYYNGVANIWHVDLETKNAELVSNSLTGLFSAIDIGRDSLLVMEYHRNGMSPGFIPKTVYEDANSTEFLGQRVVENNPGLKDLVLPPAAQLSDSLISYEGAYSVWKDWKLANAYPDISGFKNTVVAGYRFNFRDPLGLSNLELYMGVSPWSNYKKKQRIHAALHWSCLGWSLNADYNKVDFYDLFGPTKVGRAGYSISGGYSRSYTFTKPLTWNWSVALATYGDMETLPLYQNVAVDSTVTSMQTAQGGLNFRRVRRSLGAVCDEQGWKGGVTAYTYYAARQLFPSVRANLSYGHLLPGLRNTDIWLHSSFGKAFGNADSVFGKFYMGGFGNNYVDYRPQSQYRNWDSMPGAEIDEISAREYGKLMLELNTTPIHFRNFGFSFLYPRYAQVSLFGAGLATDFFHTRTPACYASAGAQLDIEIVLFNYLKTTWSAGYGHLFPLQNTPFAADKGKWMFSLKLLD